jgi:serine protease inhibitor
MSASRLFANVVTALTLAACSRLTEPRGAPAELHALPRDLTPIEQQLIDASNSFSFALWSRVSEAQANQNVFISPLSASFALGMALNGAAGESFDQMRTALQVGGVSQQDINVGFKSLTSLLTSLDPSVTTRIANSIWYRQTFPVNQSFVDAGKSYFDAEVAGLNFNDVSGSLATINGWVSQKTNGKIAKVLDDIDSSEVMFVLNALYFHGNWREKFDPSKTTDDRFTTAPGVTQSMRLMHRQDTILYAETPSYQAVDLPYGNGAFAMTVVLPKTASDIESVSAALTQASWRSLLSSFVSEKVDLSLPKFSLGYERSMNDDLRALGMVAPFVPDAADFTRMSPLGKQIFISLVKQNTFLNVDEEGTEAAAVTVVGFSVTSVGSSPVMRVDHPFLIVIHERLSGTVLFMGKIVRIP